MVCSFIRLTGLSDTAAGAMAGVTRSTLARWKKEDEEVEMMLDQARFQYQAPRLAIIDETRLKDGQPDWRAQAWLVKFANPEVYGAPSRRRKLRDVELEAELSLEEKRAKEEAEGHAAMAQALKDWEEFQQSSQAFFASGKVITPQMLALLQQRRAIALRDNEYDEPQPAAAPAQDGRTGSEPAPSGGVAAPPAAGGPAKSVTIRPEIHSLHRDDASVSRPADAAYWAAIAERRRVALLAD